mmetsp:Transcript_106659/g.184770  ORF Transcript_106659/g.184770 Transcript_106659/m.184770 type:complete len:585 (-) Transcript_106659:56-1810(-)
MSVRISLTACAAAVLLACAICTGHGKRMLVRNSRAETPVKEYQNAEAESLKAAEWNYPQRDGKSLQRSHMQYQQLLKALSRLLLAFRSPTLGPGIESQDALTRRGLGRRGVTVMQDSPNINAFSPPQGMQIEDETKENKMDYEVIWIGFPTPFGFMNDTLDDFKELPQPFAEGGPWRKVKALAMTRYGEVDLVEKNHDVFDVAEGLPDRFVVKSYHHQKMKAMQSRMEKKVSDSAWNEIRAFERLRRHDFPGVVKVYGTWRGKDCIYVATEYCPGGNMFDRMIEGKITTEEQVRDIIDEQLFILRRFHDEGFAHQDLSLSNFLMCADGTLKLVDFGQAMRVHGPEGEHIEEFLTIDREGHPGQADYVPPELLRRFHTEGDCMGVKYSAKKLDMFQIGVGLLRLLTRRPPHLPKELSVAGGPDGVLFPPAEAESDRCRRVRQFLRNSTERIVPISTDCVDFLERLLAPKRSKRPDVFEASQHPWITKGPGNVTASASGKQEWRLDFYREMITDVYQDFNPSKVGEVDELMTMYKGREQDLYKAVRTKYLGKDPIRRQREARGQFVPRSQLSELRGEASAVEPGYE